MRSLGAVGHQAYLRRGWVDLGSLGQASRASFIPKTEIPAPYWLPVHTLGKPHFSIDSNFQLHCDHMERTGLDNSSGLERNHNIYAEEAITMADFAIRPPGRSLLSSHGHRRTILGAKMVNSDVEVWSLRSGVMMIKVRD
jgi:hypothetical protein